MIVDDLRNVTGCETGVNEIFYDYIARKKAIIPWKTLWATVSAQNAVHGYFIDKIMFHYTPLISAFIGRNSIEGVHRCLKFEPDLFDHFYNFFARAVWVYVDRRDVFAQAVSMYLAEATQIWEHSDRLADQPPPPAIGYDYGKLQQYLRGFLTEREQWQVFFRHYNIEPIRITYEDAVAGYPHYLKGLLDKTGLPVIETPPPRRYVKVGGELNERWGQLLRNDVIAELYSRTYAGI
jgi:LPS sulfotransferase NodH